MIAREQRRARNRPREARLELHEPQEAEHRENESEPVPHACARETPKARSVAKAGDPKQRQSGSERGARGAKKPEAYEDLSTKQAR